MLLMLAQTTIVMEMRLATIRLVLIYAFVMMDGVAMVSIVQVCDEFSYLINGQI